MTFEQCSGCIFFYMGEYADDTTMNCCDSKGDERYNDIIEDIQHCDLWEEINETNKIIDDMKKDGLIS